MTPAELERANQAELDGRYAFDSGRERKAPSPVPWRGYSGWWYIGYDNARLDAQQKAREEQPGIP